MDKKILEQLIGILGRNNVQTTVEDLICYSYDATAGEKGNLPEAVVTPETTKAVADLVKIANKHKIPLYPRGAGTNLSGGTIPAYGGIVVSFAKMNRILEIDVENLTATVQPGAVIQSLNEAVMSHGLFYPPDPGTVATATMGGSVAECAGGLRGLKYGVTKHYIMGLEVVVPNGDIIRVGGKTVKNVTGYDLTKLFTGSEGTLGIITEITVRLAPAPEARRSMMAVFNNLDDAAQTITGIIKNKVIPATLEIMDNTTIRMVEEFARVGLPVEAEAVLLIEVDGITEVIEKEAELVLDVCKKNNAERIQIAETDSERDILWAARRAALPALSRVKSTTILEDATVPRSQIPAMIRAVKEISLKHGLIIGTFGHAGDGNLHPTILCDARDEEEMKRVKLAVDDIFKTALELGGTLSGEHGIGSAKADYLEWELGSAGIGVMTKIKEALDPNGIMNPGKFI